MKAFPRSRFIAKRWHMEPLNSVIKLGKGYLQSYWCLHGEYVVAFASAANLVAIELNMSISSSLHYLKLNCLS